MEHINIENQEKLWEKHFEVGTYDEKYPSEQVVRFLFRFLKSKMVETNGLKALDLGCGPGRHLSLFAENGLNTYGCDLANSALISAKKYLSTKNLSAELIQTTLTKLPYKNNFFDIILSFGVLDHVSYDDAILGVEETFRCLKPGGQIYFKLEGVDSPGVGEGKLIGDDLYILKGDCENNMIQHFFTRERVFELFSKFKILNFEKEIITDILNDDCDVLIARWHIIAEK